MVQQFTPSKESQMAFGYPKYMRRKKKGGKKLVCRFGKVKRGKRKGRCLKNRRAKK